MSDRKHILVVGAPILLLVLLALTECSLSFDQPPSAAFIVTPSSGATVGTQITLDASSSSDPQGYTLQYSWILTRPANSTTALSATNAIVVTFTPDVAGTYTTVLQVSAVSSSKKSAQISKNITVTTPTADQPPSTAFIVTPSSGATVGRQITLDASSSSDPQGYTLQYSWTMTGPASSIASLSATNMVIVTFIPDVAGTYTVVLQASAVSSSQKSAQASKSITVSAPNANTYTLTVQSGGNGTVSPSGTQIVTSGAATNIIASADTGYTFVNWTRISGSGTVSFLDAISLNTTVTLTGGNATIQANFIQTFGLTITAGTGGSVSPSGTQTVTSGAATNIIASADAGYAFLNWTVVGGSGVSFGDRSSPSTEVTLSGGNAAIQANFKTWITFTPGQGNQFYGPMGIVMDGSGRIFVADTYNGRIVRIDDMTGTGWANLSGFVQPAGIAVDGSGHIYIAEYAYSRVVRVDDIGGTGRTELSFPGGSPVAIAVDNTGRIYVADHDNMRIVRVNDMSGSGWTSLGSLGSATNQFNRPWGITLDGGGHILVADRDNNRIVRMDDMVGTGWATLGGFNGPYQIALDGSGYLYVVDAGDNLIVETKMP